MKKTISITLSGILFHIEEDAYEKLSAYLDSIRAYFAPQPNSAEILSDIENRISEQFLENGSKDKIVTIKNVEALIASMGTAKDFSDAEDPTETTDAKSTNSENAKNTKQRKLFRNPDDVIIAGVASGLGAYFGIDPTIIRLIFIVIVLLGGSGILIYIILWFIMPIAKTSTDKLQMRGERVTLESVNELVREKVNEVKGNKGLFRKIITFPFIVIGRIAKVLAPILRKIIGFIFSFVAVIAVLGISVALGFALLNFSESFVGFPIHAVVPDVVVIVFLFAIYFALFVPLLFILFLGNSFMNKKSSMPTNATISLLGLWFIALLIGGIIAANYSARIIAYIDNAPEYQQVSRSVDVLPFTSIVARNGAHIIYTQGTSTSVTISGRLNNLDRMSVKSENGTLVVIPENQLSHFCLFCNVGDSDVIVTTPFLAKFDGENGVRFEGSGIVPAPSFSVNLSNGSNGVIDIQGGDFSAEIENGVYLELKGEVIKATLNGRNGAKIDASELTAKEANISVTNASKAEIGKTEVLNTKARNGASIHYTGTPVLTKNAENGGSVESINEE